MTRATLTGITRLTALVVGILVVAGVWGDEPARVPWKACLRQKPEWYASPEAVRIADNVLLYQRNSGGWHKNIDMATPLTPADRERLIKEKAKTDSTIDNGATHTQLAFLARVATAAKLDRHRDAFLKGYDYLLRAQYSHGGWPQIFPNPTGYHRHVTFNDDAMTGVLRLLRDVVRGAPEYAFVDAERRTAADRAVRRGVECILKCQVVVDGRRTAWCAQHDSTTLQPAPARTYEKISLSGSESVGVVEFLMGIDQPTPEVVEAVQAAVAWLNRVKLTGIRVEQKRDPTSPKGYDRVVVADPNAPPLWARFYDIGTNRPIFCGRDGVIKASVAEIEYERRNGYAWYVNRPAVLLARDYPAWQKKWAPGKNVLD